MTVLAWSEMSHPTEEQYLLREFGVRIESTCPSQVSARATDSSVPVLVTADPYQWRNYAESLPLKSLIVFLVGNETQEKEIFEELNTWSSLRHAFVYNPPRPGEWSWLLKMLVAHVVDGGLVPSSNHGSVLQDFLHSVRMSQNSRRTKMKYPFTELPQGYSNSFVEACKTLDERIASWLVTEQSLLSGEFSRLVAPFLAKDQLFTFVGQLGNHRRWTAEKLFSKLSNSTWVNKRGFGGQYWNGDTDYLQSIVRARFPVIPPGWCNNYNHRYLEVLLTGGLPVILRNNSLDGNRSANWTSQLPGLLPYSFRSLFRWMAPMSFSEVDEWRGSALANEVARTMKASARFQKQIVKH